MGTNKTRVLWADYAGSTPHGVFGEYEFDIYQEAVDYVETSLKNISGSGGISYQAYLYSYDNASYKYSITSTGTLSKAEIVFPDLFS